MKTEWVFWRKDQTEDGMTKEEADKQLKVKYSQMTSSHKLKLLMNFMQCASKLVQVFRQQI